MKGDCNMVKRFDESSQTFTFGEYGDFPTQEAAVRHLRSYYYEVKAMLGHEIQESFDQALHIVGHSCFLTLTRLVEEE
jgi:hypothetical protein